MMELVTQGAAAAPAAGSALGYRLMPRWGSIMEEAASCHFTNPGLHWQVGNAASGCLLANRCFSASNWRMIYLTRTAKRPADWS